jgi:hypothetical protein
MRTENTHQHIHLTSCVMKRDMCMLMASGFDGSEWKRMFFADDEPPSRRSIRVRRSFAICNVITFPRARFVTRFKGEHQIKIVVCYTSSHASRVRKKSSTKISLRKNKFKTYHFFLSKNSSRCQSQGGPPQ